MDEDDRRERSGGPTFDPPVYRQRYEFIANTVREYGAKKVIDFGCSEGKLISRLKRVECIEELIGIDIDQDTLEFNQIKAKPFAADYLDPRSNPLTVSFYQGSIALCDERFVNYDVIACVEIIEHLHPPILEAMPGVVFGHLLPKVVVVTTPNSEFNVLFPGLKGFRHYDHKFEWTRAEFQKWSIEVAAKFAYTVSFTGVGDGPSGTEHLGKCSQIAIFVKNDHHCENRGAIPAGERTYVKIISCIHPFKQERSIEESLTDELEYYTLMLAAEYKSESDSKRSEIPLERFFDFSRISKLSKDVELLRSVIKSCPVLELNEDGTAVVYVREHCDWPSDDDEEENKCSSWDSEGVSSCYNAYYKLEDDSKDSAECWDVDMESEQVITECWDDVPMKGGVCSESSIPNNSVGASGGCHEMESKTDKECRSWMFWRGGTTNVDCEGGSGDDEEEGILDQEDYTW